jgi:uncharacterized protein (TIGR03435 family)
MSVVQLIQFAYNGGLPGAQTPIAGGPAWINSEHYQVSAVWSGTQTLQQLVLAPNPMLQTLLEERFKLKAHRETVEVPVYALTIAPGGPKVSMTPVSLDRGGLERFEEGGCVVFDPDDRRLEMTPRSLRDMGCNYRGLGMRPPNATAIAIKSTLDEFARVLSPLLDRPVVGRTGIAGLFNTYLVFAPDAATPRLLRMSSGNPNDPASAPGIFTALREQLGLRLEAARAGVESLVIDSVERPSEN